MVGASIRVLVWCTALTLVGCGQERVTAFVGATLIDGTGAAPVEDAVIVVSDGRVEGVGSRGSIDIPSGANEIDLSGQTVIPGLINAHGHVGATRGLDGDQYSGENVIRQLRLYARYGVTTVASLGGDQEPAVALRDVQHLPGLDRSRIYVAGEVVTGSTPDAAREVVSRNAGLATDFIKIRVDDNLGTSPKMPPDVYHAVIDDAHERGLPVAAHMYYLDDAKALLRAGTDFLVHSVRDQPIDDELIGLLRETGVCYSPTLTREVSTFIYEEVPAFFTDPFFLSEVDPDVLEQLSDPERQEGVRASPLAQAYKRGLPVAMENLRMLADEGIPVAFGTDTGPPGRFQGFFEHMEIELMAEAGLSPMQILRSATGVAAQCLGLEDDVGTIETGKWADFVVLDGNPRDELRNMRRIESVWIAGNRVPARASP